MNESGKVNALHNGVMTLFKSLKLRKIRITLCELLLMLWNATSVADSLLSECRRGV